MSYRGKTRVRRQPTVRLTSGAQALRSSPPPANREQEGPAVDDSDKTQPPKDNMGNKAGGALDMHPDDPARREMMKVLIPTDPAATSSMTEGTVRWVPNNAYSQAIGNKPEYAGQVRQVGPNILPICGSIHLYYRPVQPRSLNPKSVVVSQMIEAAFQTDRETHRAEIDALLEAQ
ncbi:hypothetical protein FH972_027141 [Carpinus fangiana]|uniref:Uncharacterized protein n=1 Tax=Carpinus fangiana TaxID=176857 RepID=A0A5N6L637_9ROSI|nr:hypothetical protein FH972_027141 [Carpinus fangiana]